MTDRMHAVSTPIGHLIADHLGRVVRIPDGPETVVGIVRGISHRDGGSTYVDLDQPIEGEPRSRFHRGPFGSRLRIVLEVPAAPTDPDVRGCPECQQGKHQNCDGHTWNLVSDSQVACPCAVKDHVRIGTERVG